MVENKLRIYRAVRHMTQESLAREVSVSRQTIISIEKGKYTPSLELAFRIAALFGVTVDELFSYRKGDKKN